jgi:cysteinyl-tRNA synthetase
MESQRVFVFTLSFFPSHRFRYGKLGREANVQGQGDGATAVVGQGEKRDPRDFVLW